ncbi:MAG: histidine--tRNA ligase [Bacteroidetes bacterium]|nr:histidine--tRNA ligase [Bacteroidota bacterium]
MIQSPRGTKDILPSTINAWQQLEDTFRRVSTLFGYQEIRTPIFENTEVFMRTIGENTDVVGKEMYTFPDKGGDSMTLRPEMTASVARAVVQHNLTATNPLQRLWYVGEFFRYERPQKGRYRQFHQFGAECIGSAAPEADVEVILLVAKLLSDIGLKEFSLEINTLANREVRILYREKLVEYLIEQKSSLSPESQERLDKNPLRVLDSKHPLDRVAIESAPTILEYLDDESALHFATVQNLLTIAGINFTISPRLVRGLDYYSHTVFEFVSTALGAQSALGGGGRYNDMFEEFGGKHTPAVGFAMGIERILMILEQTNPTLYKQNTPDVMMITLENESYPFSQTIAQLLRNDGISTVMDVQGRSLKAQMREADRLGAAITIIIGENERTSGQLTVKNMKTGMQETATQENIIEIVQKMLRLS